MNAAPAGKADIDLLAFDHACHAALLADASRYGGGAYKVKPGKGRPFSLAGALHAG
jgi:hypothetical protein